MEPDRFRRIQEGVAMDVKETAKPFGNAKKNTG
jgi:hypothetical protein